jgi:outer membrane receptor protein involved in Fe transport
MKFAVPAALCAVVLLVSGRIVVAQTPSPYRVEIIETTPLPGVNLPVAEIPAPAQTVLESDMQRSGSTSLADALNRRLTSVFVNEIQGNPFQPDVNYRGYTASPLLGTPQGLSVYMDGVRLNQPFGDVVAWDLIPRLAIASTTLMPGSNPLFGLNTLGGALAVQTKDGRSHSGTSFEVVGGEFGRRAVEFEHGGKISSGVDWYVAANLFHDSGWRASSPSDVRQLFAKTGWQDARTELHVTGSFADNVLTGNGLQEQRLLAADYASVYTTPDTTHNRSTFVNFTLRRSFTPQIGLSMNAYSRHIVTDSLNGDVNEDSLDQPVYQLSAADVRALTAGGYTGFSTSGSTAANTPFPFWRCIAQVLERDEPGEACNGLLNRTSTTQHNYGAAGQLSVRSNGNLTRNQLTVGGAFDRSTAAFVQSSQLGYLNPDRSVAPIAGAFEDGVAAGNVDGAPLDNRVDLDGVVQTASAFVTNTTSVVGKWHVTLSGRFNHTSVSNHDGLTPIARPGSLTGSDTFSRFNPAAGVTFNPSRSVNLYVGYSEGSRAPTSVELGCADPSTPCKLPNALAGDPPLDQVVTRTWEAGVRGGNNRIDWNVGVFRGANTNDLLFVASTQTGFGYFKNFGRTRRQGIELGASARVVDRMTVGAGYSILNATYQSDETLLGQSNSSNNDGVIDIRAGDRIPLIPRQTLKLYAALRATSKLSIDLDLVAASGSIARGNENDGHLPDGLYYVGPGSTPGYAVMNAGLRYTLTKALQLVVHVNNVFDTRYYSAAQLGPTAFTSAGAFIARPLPAVGGAFPVVRSTFYAPGAPAMWWAGVRVVM